MTLVYALGYELVSGHLQGPYGHTYVQFSLLNEPYIHHLKCIYCILSHVGLCFTRYFLKHLFETVEDTAAKIYKKNETSGGTLLRNGSNVLSHMLKLFDFFFPPQCSWPQDT